MFELLVALNVIDDAGYQTYRTQMAPILERHGGGFGHDFRVSEVLASETEAPINRVFTLRFPDETAKESFFANEDYLAVRREHFDRSVADATILASYER